jgi:hypothetical protein
MTLGSTADLALYQGAITELAGTDIRARFAAQGARPLRVELALQINPTSGAATGTLHVGLEGSDR